MSTSIYDFRVRSIGSDERSLAEYRGKVLLIVNTASHCGFTPQYEGLESLYREYRGRGLEVLAFPCNQFGAQEPGDKEEIQRFCEVKYGTTFPLFEKVDVNGSSAHPLYEFLKAEAPGIFGSKAIKWNFTKFLVGRDGRVIKRFAPRDTPSSLRADIETALQATAPTAPS